jgi:hypothetical protein
MDALLTNDLKNFNDILFQTVRTAEQHLSRIETLAPGRYIDGIEKMTLPNKGIGAMNTLKYFEEQCRPKVFWIRYRRVNSCSSRGRLAR